MQGSPSLTQAASGAARQIAATVSVDKLRNGSYTDITAYCSAFTIDRSLTTDVPTAARQVTGYAVSQLSLQANGDPTDNAKDAPYAWSPYNTASGRPLSGASGRIETPIKVKAGMTNATGSVETVDVFNGYIRSIDVDSAGGTASITGLDGSDRMRSQVAIPMFVADQTNTLTNTPQSQGLTSAWVLDYLFRANGKYSTPRPRAQGAFISVPGHGSMNTDYFAPGTDGHGTLVEAWDAASEDYTKASGATSVISYIQDTGNDGRTGKTKFKFGQCADPQKGVHAMWNITGADITIAANSNSWLSIEAWVDLSNPLGVASGSPLWAVKTPVYDGGVASPSKDIVVGFAGDGRPFIKIGTGASAGTPVYGTAPSGTKTWLYSLISIFTTATAASATFLLNGTAPTTGNGRIISSAATYTAGHTWTISSAVIGSFEGSGGGPGARARWEGLQLTTESSGTAIAATNFGFVPEAKIEPSLNNLVLVPFTAETQDSWSVSQEITGAEFGTLFFDEAGILNFWNRNHFRFASGASGVGTPVSSVTSTRNLESLTSTEAVDAVSNHIVLTSSPPQIQPAGWVYQLGNKIGLHSNTSYEFTANFANPAINVPVGSASFMPLGGASGANYYRACRTPDGSGAQVSNMVVTITAAYTQSASVFISNPNNFPVYMVGPANDSAGNPFPSNNVGVPFLWIWGQSITQDTASTISSAGATGTSTSTATVFDVSDAHSIALYGEQKYDVPTSNYLQDTLSLQSTVSDMLDTLAYPYPVLSNVTISAIPGLQIGDRITLNDPTGALIADDFFIVGISSSVDPTAGYTQSLTLRSANGPNSFILDDAVRGALNSTYVLNGTF